MAQDPEQQPNIDETPDPQFPYGATPKAAPSYFSPEFYAAQSDTPVQKPLESSGYTVPTPDPYQASQEQYGVAANYGHGGYSPGYEYSAPSFAELQPQATPLPLGEAIRQLPAQYWRVITRPSSTTFAAEMGKARWNIVWVQMAFYVVLVTIVGFLSNVFVVQSRADALSTTNTPALTPNTVAIIQRVVSIITVFSTYGQILLIPLSLFVGTGLLFMLAKAFGGSGKFLPQLYSTLLFLVPLGLLLNLLTLLLSLLPGIGSMLSFLAVFAYLGYEGTLLGLMLIPVHRLSGGRAAGAVLSLFGVAILLSCVLGFIIAIVLTASLHP
ncbi:MAG: hypothetical protein PVS3B3_23400 [Ktedonobacteraceae bacterium]